MNRPVALLLASCLLAGCTRLAMLVYSPPSIEECGGPLPAVDPSAPDFVRRLRIQVESEEVTQGFDLVVQKRGDTLTLVGFTRFGARAFSVVQSGTEVTVDSAMQPLESVPPENVLRDLHRWPLRTLPTPAHGPVRLEVEGDAAQLVHEPCGYRTRIVDVEPVAPPPARDEGSGPP